MYDFGIEEKEFQLMLDVANEKLELNENRFRIISNTMHRIRDSGKLSEYDKTQVSLLCNKFSIAIENLNGKTEYEVAMEEMSGGMMALIAAAIAAVIAMLAKMFGFFGTTTDGTAPTKANLEALKNTATKTKDIVRSISDKLITINNKIQGLNTDSVTLSAEVSECINKIKSNKNLLCVTNYTEYGIWGYPKFIIVKIPDKTESIESYIKKMLPTLVEMSQIFFEPSEKIFKSALDYINNSEGDKLLNLIKTKPQMSKEKEQYQEEFHEYAKLCDSRKDENVQVSENKLWESITVKLIDHSYEKIENVSTFINFLDLSEKRKNILTSLQNAINNNTTSLSGIKELNEYISEYNAYTLMYTSFNNEIINEYEAVLKSLKLYVIIVSKIITKLQDIKHELLKNNIQGSREIDTLIAGTALLFNNIINEFIELSKNVPKFETTKTSQAFKICESIAKTSKFKLTQ